MTRFFAVLSVAVMAVGCCNISPESLRCEYMENPNSIDAPHPKLSWINTPVGSHVKGEYQTAYRIRVASSKSNLRHPDLWDSGKVGSSESHLVKYAGEALTSGLDCWWQVRVWDSNGRASGWSRPGRWTTGVMNADEWKAEWIGAPWHTEAPDGYAVAGNIFYPKAVVDPRDDKPAPLFRKSFNLDRKLVSAKVFVTGLGHFEFYANGERVGEECLVPNFTNYTRRDNLENLFIGIDGNFGGYRVMYLVYDITDLLSVGTNAIGLAVGNGWYNTHGTRFPEAFGSPRMLCQVKLTYSDGTEELILSDTTWKVKPSAIVKNDVYRGEVFDARLYDESWADAGHDDSGWQYAVARKAPCGRLTASSCPMDKVTKRLKPVVFERTEEGYEVDFGEEISGWIRFKDVRGNAGDTLRVRYICDQANGEQCYVFAGKPCEDWSPKFTWYVFRRAIISGVECLSAESLVAEAVNTDVPVMAEFESSAPILSRINEIWRRSQLDNMHGCIASDCPHRERSPYTGDGQVVAHTVMSNFDAAAFYAKWIRDIRDSQNAATGYVPNAAPWQPGCGGGVAWGAAIHIIPWEFYRHYGDADILSENYAAMKGYLQFLKGWINEDGTMLMQMESTQPGAGGRPEQWLTLGEWVGPYGLPDAELVHTFYLWLCADITAKTAKLTAPSEAGEFSSFAASVKSAFHRKFYNAETCSYGKFGSNVFALYMGVPEDLRAGVVEALRRELQDEYKSHFTTGIFGTRYLLEVLAGNGLNDLAYDIMTAEDFPSFGYWIAQGATTTWEKWNGDDSRNHPMFGGCLSWYEETLAGIRIDESAPGYRNIIIRPVLASGLESVGWSKMTPYGVVRSRVTHKEGHGTMSVTIPVGSRACVWLPGNADPLMLVQGEYHLDF